MFIDAEPDRDPPSVRRAMFIDAAPGQSALRQEGNVLDSVIRHIRNRDKHLTRVSFRSESLTMLKNFDIAYEPKNVLEFFTDE